MTRGSDLFPAMAPCPIPSCTGGPHRHAGHGIGAHGAMVSVDFGTTLSAPTITYRRTPRSKPKVLASWRSYPDAIEWLESTAAMMRQALDTDRLRGNA